MAIQYSGGTLIDFTFTSDGTKLNLVNNLDTELAAAGWTAISGAGGTNPIYESATTPQGLKIRVDFDSTGATSCMRLRLSNGTINSAYSFLLPVNGSTFRILANKYQFFFYLTGTSTTTTRSLICAGTPWLPTQEVDGLGGDAYYGWMHATGWTDTSTAQTSGTMRNKLGSSIAGYAVIVSGATFTNTGTSRLSFINENAGAAADAGIQWESGTFIGKEPILVWPTGVADGTTLTRRGQLWDAIMDTNALTSDVIRRFENHAWRNICHSNTTAGSRGSLLIAIT